MEEREPLMIFTNKRLNHLQFPQPQLPSLNLNIITTNLPSLPEDQQLLTPLPMTPSEFKQHLIFGPSPPSNYTPTRNDTPTFFNDTHFNLTPDNNNNYLKDTALNENLNEDEYDVNAPSPTSTSSAWLTDPLLIQRINLHRSRTAPALAVATTTANGMDPNHHTGVVKPKFMSSDIVIKQGVILLVLYLLLGIVIFWINRESFSGHETHPVVDALYFCIVTMCTIGYGDITPISTTTKLFSILFVLVGFGFIDILLSSMVSYVLDLQESLLLNAVKGGKEQKSSYFFDLKKGRVRIRMKVGLALGVVVLCIGVGTGVMHFIEKLDWLDSFYLSVMSVTTVGYGDRAFKSMGGRMFASIWLLVSTLAVARAFLYLAEWRIDKRHRTMAKWVLRQDMTVSQFLAADIDNNGFVSKSEYVIYKLKEMGKIAQKDISQICNQFDRLDTGNCGKITLADLMEHHH